MKQDQNLPASVYLIVDDEWERVRKMLEVLRVSLQISGPALNSPKPWSRTGFQEGHQVPQHVGQLLSNLTERHRHV